MKGFLQVCVVAVVLTLFYSAVVGWSLGTLLSCFLTAAVLVVARNGIRATQRIERIAVLAWLFWGLSYVSNLGEALYFHVIPTIAAGQSLVFGLGLAIVVACILESLLPAKSLAAAELQIASQVRTAPHLWWRIPLLATLFSVFYLAAGAAIFPWVASFYRDRPMPSLGHLFALQICRGLLDTACIFPLLQRWNQSRWRAAWLSAGIFTVLCGWGPLLLPNRFMPAPIRLAHGVEMGASGIVFGIVTVMLLLKHQRRTAGKDIASGSAALNVATI